MIPYRRTDWLHLLVSPRGTFSSGVPTRVLSFGLIALAVWAGHRVTNRVELGVGLHEVAGAVIALMLAFRVNTGYNRFWEGRTLWGAIVNAARSVTRIVNEHAAVDEAEKRDFAVWTVVFVHACRRSLRAEDEHPEVARLISPDEAAAYAAAPHRPMFAAARMSARINRYLRDGVMDPMMAQRAESEVVDLMVRIGGAERILKTPTPLGIVLLLQRAIALFLATLPLALVHTLGVFTVLVTMMVAYLVLMIEALGAELDDPFGHEPNDLPLSRITDTIEKNLLGSSPLELILASTPTPGYED